MSKEYLHQLSVEPSVLKKIAQLDVPTPASLLSMIKAAPEAFNNFVGQEVAKELEDKLYILLSDNEKHVFQAPFPKNINYQGAMLDDSEMRVQPPTYDISERDALFNKIQDLKAVTDPTPDVERHLVELQNNLEALLTKK